MAPSIHRSVRDRARTADILVVEDDDIDARGIIRALKKAGFVGNIHRAIDGVDALEYLAQVQNSSEQEIPRFMIVDINMPRMGGLELIDEIRKNPHLTSKIIFVLTTSDLSEDIEAAYKNHVAGYIVKSNTGDDYQDLINLLHNYSEIVELP